MTYLKSFALFAIMSVMIMSAGLVEAAGVGTYSEGYRVGQLTKFSVKGMMMKSGEGQMLMGSESTPYTVYSGSGKDKTKKIVNPWYFSSDKSWKKRMSNLIGEYVVIKYSQARVKGVSRDTDYEVLEMDELSDKSDLPSECVAESFKSGSKSEGKRVGRLVKLSLKGTVSKTYEAMFQQGNSGNQFKSMSISSQKMFNCALKFLKTGSKVKIEYSESFFKIPGLRDTTYDIVKITRAKSGMSD